MAALVTSRPVRPMPWMTAVSVDIVQEALANSAKHAGAAQAWVAGLIGMRVRVAL